MRKKTLARLGHVVRLLIAMTALAGAGTVAVYRWAPAQIDRLDRSLVERWGNDRVRQWDALAARSAPVDSDLGRMRRETDGALTGDRDFAVWRQATSRSIDSALQQGRFVDARRMAETWVERDGRDFPARLALCDALLADESTRAEGQTMLRTLQRMLPGQPAVVRRIARVFKDSPGVVGEAVAGYLRRGSVPMWTMQYDGSDSLSPLLDMVWVHPRRDVDGLVRTGFWLPAGSRGVAVVLPVGRTWRLQAARMRIGDSGMPQPPALVEGAVLDGQAVLTGQAGGKLAWPLPEATTEPQYCSFEASVEQRVEAWLSELLVGPPGKAMADTLAATAAGHEDGMLLHRWRALDALQRPGRVSFIHDGGPQRGAEVEAACRVLLAGGEGAPVHCQVGWQGLVRQLTWSPPLPTGCRLRDVEARFFDEAGRLLGSTGVRPAARHQLESAGGDGWTVVGASPSCAWDVPAGARLVRITGVLP